MFSPSAPTSQVRLFDVAQPFIEKINEVEGLYPFAPNRRCRRQMDQRLDFLMRRLQEEVEDLVDVRPFDPSRGRALRRRIPSKLILDAPYLVKDDGLPPTGILGEYEKVTNPHTTSALYVGIGYHSFAFAGEQPGHVTTLMGLYVETIAEADIRLTVLPFNYFPLRSALASI